MHSPKYTIVFVLILSAVTALLLSGMYTGLKDIHEKNEAIFNKRAILSAIDTQMDIPVDEMTDDEVLELFNNSIEQIVLDMKGNILTKEQVEAKGYKGGLAEKVSLNAERKKPEDQRILPLFKFNKDGKTTYIICVIGNGLWDIIWGYIALGPDGNTIAGAAFDHKNETPGLGAEIRDNADFPASFIGKKIYDNQGKYHSVSVVKGGAKDLDFEVDGISGATLTGDGVSEMMVRGVAYYNPYLKSIQSAKNN